MKLPALPWQFIRYGIVVFGGLLINLGTTYIGVEVFHLWYFFAFIIGVLTSWTVSFVALAFFVFPEHEHAGYWRRYAQFVVGYSGLFCINAAVVYIGTSIFGLYYLFSIVISAMTTGVPGFLFSKKVVYTVRSHSSLMNTASIIINRMQSQIKRHWLALVFALCAGILCIAPAVYFSHVAPGYRGIAMMGSDDEEHYVARIQEVNAGYSSLGNVFLPDKNVPYLAPGLGENIVARLGNMVDMDASVVNVFSKFLFPFLITLLVYALCYALFESRALALLGTMAALVGDNLVSGPQAWLALLHGVSTSVNFLTLARPINPEVTDVFLFGGMILFYNAFIKRAPRAWEIALLGLIAGTALYVSPYPFTFLCGMLGVSFFWFAYQRDWSRVRGIFLSGALMSLCSIPFVLNYLRLVASTEYSALALRQGLVHSHTPLISFWLAIMLVLALFVWPKRYPQARIFYLFSVIVLIILTDQQIVTGVSVVPSHYHWYITKPLVGIFISMYAWVVLEWATKRQWLRALGIATILSLLFYNTFLIQLTSYNAQYQNAVALQKYAPTLAYLNTLSPGMSIWADQQLSSEISVYTKQNAPNNFYALYYLVSQQYLVERMLLGYELEGIPTSDILTTLKRDRESVSGEVFGIYYREQYGSDAAIPDSLLETYADEYKAQIARPLASVFHDLGATHIILDKSTDSVWHITTFPFAHLVFSEGSIFVYQIDSH
jgi:putative flippase GtrA